MTLTRVLFVDDSGKPSQNDGTHVMVIGGFSISSHDVSTFSRRVAGAKSRFFPQRGNPGTWELKARETIRPKRLRRSKNRKFLTEMCRILQALDCTIYSRVSTKAGCITEWDSRPRLLSKWKLSWSISRLSVRRSRPPASSSLIGRAITWMLMRVSVWPPTQFPIHSPFIPRCTSPTRPALTPSRSPT